MVQATEELRGSSRASSRGSGVVYKARFMARKQPFSLNQESRQDLCCELQNTFKMRTKVFYRVSLLELWDDFFVRNYITLYFYTVISRLLIQFLHYNRSKIKSSPTFWILLSPLYKHVSPTSLWLRKITLSYGDEFFNFGRLQLI